MLEGAGYNEVYTAAAGQLYTTKRTALQSFFQFIFRYVSYNKRSFAPDGIKRDLVLAYRAAILYNSAVRDEITRRYAAPERLEFERMNNK